jgi:predicted RecA/RadA family phage recombinase
MAYRVKKNIDQTTSIPLSRVAKPSEISSYIKRLITASQYDYHEAEAMEVQRVTLNKPGNRGSVSGTFLNSGEVVDNVKPLFGNLTTIPVIGEHVVVTEFNGQFFYSAIINRKGSVNENSIPGASGTYTENTKYGKTFERKKVKPIEIGEGCITFDGRFGQTLHFDGHDNTPKIKISTHVDESGGDFRKEKIDDDDASIYLLSRGMRDNFDGQTVEGKKVLIKSNGIFISGDDVRLGSSVETKIESVVKGDSLKELLDDIFKLEIPKNNATIVKNTASIAALVTIQPPNPAAPQAREEIEALTEENNRLIELNLKLEAAIRFGTYLSKTVKTA